MANKRSSKKDIRRSAKRRVRNQEVRTGLKTHVKKVRQAAAIGDGDKAASTLLNAISALDKAAQRGIIHKKQAARRKSRIAKVAHAVAGQVPVEAVAVEKRASKV